MSTALLLALLAGCGGAPAPRPPDVLLITLDTFRVDVVGAYGGSQEATPQLDALAAAGARFERAYTVTPLTIPAHSSVHTGLYPPRHGVRDNGDYFLSDEALTLAERLDAAGYATMAAVGAEVTSHHWGFAQGFDAYFDDLGPVEADGNRWRVERPGADVVADALKWWREPVAAPRFGWVHLFDAHHPYEAPEPFASRFERRPYLAEIAAVDALVGELVEAVGPDTVVVVVADHGEGLGDHGEGLHGMLLYDATTRIPMLVRAPGVAPAVIPAPASLVDVAPTILGLVGLPALDGVDGLDWSGPLRGAASMPAARDLYLETLYPWRHYGWAAQHALVDPDYKLIDSTTPKLFHREDRREQESLAGDLGLLDPRSERLRAWRAAMDGGGVASPVQASSTLIGQLEALGYTTAVAEAPAEGAPDPEDRIGLLPRLEAVRHAAREGDLAAVEEGAAAILAEDPGLVEPRLLLATALLKHGQAERTRDLAAEVLALQETAAAWSLLGLAELRLGNRDVGVEHLRRAVDTDPHLINAWTAYLQALLVLGDPARLREESERALELLPEQPEIRAMVGISRGLSGDAAGARPLLEGAFAERPDLPLLRHGLAVLAQADGELGEAERLFREEVERFPPGLVSRRFLVALYASQRRFADQLAELRAIEGLEPPSVLTRHAIAQARFNLEDHAGALEDARACRAMAAEYAPCALLEANALKKLGREAEAQAAYEQALALAEAARAAAAAP